MVCNLINHRNEIRMVNTQVNLELQAMEIFGRFVFYNNIDSF